MRTTSERGIIDTNVLVAAFDAASPEHLACRRLVEDAEAGRVQACLAPMVLFEFMAVVTNTKRVRTARSPVEAAALIEKISHAIPMIHPPHDIHFRVSKLYRDVPHFSGKQVFDLVLAITALTNGVTGIYTYNDKDFLAVPGLEVLTP